MTIFIPPGLRGAVLGNDLAAVVTGDLPVTYRSPVAGTHYLLGLKPNTFYRTPIGGSVSSPAGVFIVTGPGVGDTVTISEGNVTPPPVLTVTGYDANPVQAGAAFQIQGSGFTPDITATYLGQPLSLAVSSASLLIARAPSVTNTITAMVIVTSGGRSATGPPLTVNPAPIPPPVGRRFELLIAPDGTPAIGKEITS